VLQSDPGNAVAQFNLGYTLDKRGRLEQAIAEFREATRMRPGLDRAWYGLGLAQAALGRHREAAAALHEAATLQPMNPHAWYALGMAHHALGEATKLKEVALHLVRFDPKMTRRLIQDSGATDLAYLVKDLLV
ncbi:MAG: tetratricopeptide repeat protein, partial [Terriglobales bacterium]